MRATLLQLRTSLSSLPTARVQLTQQAAEEATSGGVQWPLNGQPAFYGNAKQL